MAANTEKKLKISCTGAGVLPLGDLLPLQDELKTLSDEDYGRLKKSLLKHGFNFPFFVWRCDFKAYTLDGHQRLKALRRLEREGYAIPPLPVAFIEAANAKQAKEKILLISSQYGRMTEKSLAGFLADADLAIADLLDSIRLPEIDVSKLMAEAAGGDAEPEAKEDQADLLQQKWETAAGQLWQAGDHRIFCGDSTNPDHVGALLDGAEPFLMITDPPYGVNYDASWRDKAAAKGQIAAGERATGKVANDDNASWLKAYELFPGSVAYVWHASAGAVQFAIDLAAAGFDIRAQIIWRKPMFAISRGHYHWQHEPCWYAVKKGAQAKWHGNRSQSTVWEITNQITNHTSHSTQKPVECMARPMRNHGGQEDDIYDPFAGSGTTLVAAERLNRRCFAMDLSPAYVAVAIERLADMGLRPKLLSGPHSPTAALLTKKTAKPQRSPKKPSVGQAQAEK